VKFILWVAQCIYLEIEQMNEGDDTLFSTVTQKKKRRFGLKFSTKKALKHSWLARLTAKARGSDLTSMTKALVFSDRTSSERCIADLQDCSTLLEHVHEIEEEKNDIGIGDAILAAGYP
jgi:hypothetical protein